MTDNKILKYTLKKVKKQVDKCQCRLIQSKKYELNLENGEMSLLRTTIDNTFEITVIKDNKKGSIEINKTDEKSVDEAIESVVDICESSEADEANDIAPKQKKNQFTFGDTEPDLDRMYDLLSRFVDDVHEKYPLIKLMDTSIDFTITTKYVMNSNKVNFKDTKGVYSFSSMFAAKEGSKSSSFNASGYSMSKLENELLEYGSIDRVLKETTGQIETQGLGDKFKGDVILTPDAMGMFIGPYLNTYLSDMPLISGTSLLKDKLNEEVASPLITLHAKPTSKEIASGYFITNDGFEAEDMTILDKGVLKTFLLSQYGANKTGLERAKNTGGGLIIESGDTSIEEMIKSIKRGVLINRVSGGHPNSSGDFTGVLKNSYYIENGEIKYALNETMITVNLKEVFSNVTAVSKERIDYGRHIFPYVKVKDVAISGK